MIRITNKGEKLHINYLYTLHTVHTYTTQNIFCIIANLVHACIIAANWTLDSIIVADFLANFLFTVLPRNCVMVPSD